ncbi:hypothetical protein U6B65_12380 [Oscillospiraceae bacterium MB08-C2-2]|nr:hypothetical protein U6B65_12380 [Oscillospiraceae bacterium MB08-C2-2]
MRERHWIMLLITLLVFAGNIVLSKSRKPFLNKLYGYTSALTGLSGIIGLALVRPALKRRLKKVQEEGILDEDRVNWLLGRFNLFAKCVLIVIAVAALVLILLLLVNRLRYSRRFHREYTAVVCWVMPGLILLALGFGFFSLDKRFDVASYMLTYSWFGNFALYILLAAKYHAGQLGKKWSEPSAEGEQPQRR